MPKLFVYGTLRGAGTPARLPNFRRVTDGEPFPTIAPSVGDHVVGELRDIPTPGAFDTYEAHNPDDPEGSLYWRFQTADGVWVYVGNPDTGRLQMWGVTYTRDEVRAALGEVRVEPLDD